MDNEQEIQAKGLTAPRVTPADVEAEIAGETYFTAADGVLGAYKTHDDVYQGTAAHVPSYGLLTICVMVLSNGFTVTGESACASPENFNEELGRKIARAKAVEKIWPLLGFRLRDKLHAGAGVPEGTWQDRLIGEYNDLSARMKKLDAFIMSEAFSNIDAEDRDMLLAQNEHMTEYLRVLEARISRVQPQS